MKTRRMKTLLRYEDHPMRFFGDGEWEQKVSLFIEERYFFGLLTKVIEEVKTITMFGNIKRHHEYWDKLIEEKSPLK